MTNIRDDISLRDDTFAEWLSIHHERANPALQTDHRVAFNAGWYSQQARIDKLEDALDWFAKGSFINEFASGQEMAERIVRRAQGALKGSDT